MIIPFTKLHGLENDYLFIDLFTHPSLPEDRIPGIARRMSHRRRGIGADGIVLWGPSREADAMMRIFNSDGSEAETCGNALRCVAKLLWENGHATRSRIVIQTRAGCVHATVVMQDGRVHAIDIDIGKPRWSRSDLPMTGHGEARRIELTIQDTHFDATCLSVGNPHCVLFVEHPSKDLILQMGPLIEHHEWFPQGINVGFCHVLNPHQIELTVWERGAGLTAACGTGAAAAFAASRYRNRVERSTEIQMPGGSLMLQETPNGHLHIIGPATRVFDGYWEEDMTLDA